MQNFKSKITKFISIMGLVTLLSLIMVGCSNKQNSTSQSDKISIVTTTNVYSDIAKNIVGKYGTATAIIDKSSVDPHDFDPTTADAKKVAQANIIVANGLGYDSWMNKLAKSVDKKPVLVGEDLMGLKSGDNPHIWYNLDMPTKYVDYLVKRLSKLDKKHAAYFKENGEKYLAKIDKIKKLVKANKGDQKPVFVSEPVFDYALQEAGYKIGDKKFEEAIENGTGKTTLIRILMGMLQPTTGSFKFAPDTEIGYVPQFRNLDADYPLSIRAFVELNTPLFKNARVKARVNQILKETHLLDIQNTRMGEASGGQKQRAYLAQALLDKPDFIILDEATASLDPVAKEELMSLIKHLNEKHAMTVLFTTHDIPLAKKYMKDYLLFKDKGLVAGKIKDLNEEVGEE